MRRCSRCGAPITSGYIIHDGVAYYCSDGCLLKDFTWEEYIALYNNDEAFYTDWESDEDE